METELLKEKDYYKSSDICLISALCCYGYIVEAIDKNETSEKAIFFIKRNEHLDEVLQLYFTHQLKVEPLSFFGFLRELKTRIYHA